MNDRDVSIKNDCQLQFLPQAGEALIFTDRLRLFTLRLLSAVERRLGRQRHLFPPLLMAAEQESKLIIPSSMLGEASITEGEWVEVRSLDEIRRTLDGENRCKGLQFMQPMEQFCGQRLRVRKKVRAFFDERAWRMLRVKNTFLLEGCICDGRGMFDQDGCDRCCYFFWKEDWLKKLHK